MIVNKKFFLPLLAGLLLTLSVAAQTQQVILPSRETTVRLALGEIERQTPYRIAVNWENLDARKTLLFPASRMSLSQLLDTALAGTSCSWEIIGDQVVIVQAAAQAPAAEPYYPPRSAMYRTALPEGGMRVVPDPWSRRQLSQEEIARVRSGYWRTNGEGTDSIGLAILNFEVGSTVIKGNYMDNARAMEAIHRTFSDKDLLTAMDFITITAAASPEGNTAHNEQLAAKRAMAVKSYIMWKYPFMNRERIFTFSIGEDWSGLRKLVEEDYATPHRYEVLDILNNDYYDSNTKRTMLKRVGYGSAYAYISRTMLPRLRGAAACMIYYKEDPKPVVIRETDTVYVDRVVEKERVVEVRLRPDGTEREPYYWALKSNLLYDAALLPDLGVEFSIGRKFSVELGGQVSWWATHNTHHNCWRIQVAGLEVRRWLGDRDKRTPLSGHYLGLYGMAGTYDVRLGGGTGYLSDMSYSAGLSYGYALPIGRSWNIDFGLAIGYVGGKYDTYSAYNASENFFPRDGRHRRNYFGPTKLKISLMWLPGGKNPGKGSSKKK